MAKNSNPIELRDKESRLTALGLGIMVMAQEKQGTVTVFESGCNLTAKPNAKLSLNVSGEDTDIVEACEFALKLSRQLGPLQFAYNGATIATVTRKSQVDDLVSAWVKGHQIPRNQNTPIAMKTTGGSIHAMAKNAVIVARQTGRSVDPGFLSKKLIADTTSTPESIVQQYRGKPTIAQ